MTMCVPNTPVEDYRATLGLYVKREDLSCPGGPPFSKTRGVYAHVERRQEKFIGVLDTSHSQGGWAVARACELLGKTCVNFYPLFKHADQSELPPVQARTRALGAQLLPLAAGRSSVLYHQAKKWMAGNHDEGSNSYMMPNALKLPESVSETALEVARTFKHRLDNSTMPVLVSASSGTIAAGVVRGLAERGWHGRLLLHMGYSRSRDAVLKYVAEMASLGHGHAADVEVIDEGYAYADRARPGPVAPFPCNEHYDLKALRWWLATGREKYKEALFWNIG